MSFIQGTIKANFLFPKGRSKVNNEKEKNNPEHWLGSRECYQHLDSQEFSVACVTDYSNQALLFAPYSESDCIFWVTIVSRG